MCFTVDHQLLFVELTEQAVEDGFLFYATFYNAPPAIKVCSRRLLSTAAAAGRYQRYADGFGSFETEMGVVPRS